MSKTIKPQSTTAYTILKQLGNDTIRKYIHESIPLREFDSHYFIKSFLDDFKNEYDDMLNAHKTLGDQKKQNQRISNLIGNYLGKNQTVLGITKIGDVESLNINGSKTTNSKWRK